MKSSIYALIIITAMVAAGIGIYEYQNYVYSGGKSVPVVKVGDKISVRYYGYIYYGGERRVFDTNIEEVAKDNATYPKTVSYKWSGKFDLLTFTVGSGSMIKGFDEGVRGMKLHERKTIVVPPDKGYQFSWSKVKNYSLVENVSVLQNLTLGDFQKIYGVQNPLENSVYRNKMYGWDSLVLYVSGPKNIVKIMNEPSVGKVYQPYENVPDFKVKVEKIENGMITIRYLIYKTPLLMPNGGIIDMVTSHGFRANYNQEVAGKTLYFVVTIEDIKQS